MSFIDDLGQLGGNLTKDLGGMADKFLEYKIAKENAKGARNVAETVQPNLAQPTPANPTKGVDSDGSTIVVSNAGNGVQSLMQNKAVVYGGGGLLLLITSVVVYKAIS